MAIDPSISLAVRPPVIQPLQIQSPLEQFAKMLSLRNLMQQNQSGELGLQEKQLGLQQLQREMAQQDRISKVLAGIGATGGPAPLQTAPAAMPIAQAAPPEAAPYTPVAGYTPAAPQAPLSTLMTPQAPAAMPTAQAAAPGRAPSAAAVSIADPYAGLPSDADLLREGGASGLAIVKNLNASREAFYKQQQEKIKLHQAALTGMASLAAGAHDEPSKVEAIAAAFSNGWIDGPTRDQLMSHPFNKKEWDDFAVNSLEGSKRLDEIRAQVNQTALEKKQAHDQLMYPSEEAKAVAEATSAGQKAAGTEPITPQQAITNKLAADIAAETAKQHAQSNAIAQAHLNIARKADSRAEQVYQNTYGPGANEALVGVDPKLRVQATTNAQKAADEYSKAVESTGNMQSIIDLARGGNKIAYAYAPTTGVLTINTAQGVKRVNMPEIKSYGGAGSAMDQIEGWLGKQTSGASIPANVLKNMEEVNRSISDSAAKNYDTKLGSINQNYHSNFKPAVKTAGGAATKISTKAEYDKLPSGAQYVDSQDGKTYTKR